MANLTSVPDIAPEQRAATTSPDIRTMSLTSLTLVAFASNSILCRLALGQHLVDAGTFTFIRLLCGGIILAVLVAVRDRKLPVFHLRWGGGLALFAYAAPFSFAYLRIPAGVGAIILIGAVQSTMIGWDLIRGRRMRRQELFGLTLAMAGLVVLTLPGASAPDIVGAALMAFAGIAWGVYSLRGKSVDDPLRATAGNFVLSLVFVVPLALVGVDESHASSEGILLAVSSGAIASGVGYAIWYTALRGLTSTQAALAQLLVPVLAALGGVLLLGETATPRLFLSGALTMAGLWLAVRGARR